jgi:hypothetical protein
MKKRTVFEFLEEIIKNDPCLEDESGSERLFCLDGINVYKTRYMISTPIFVIELPRDCCIQKVYIDNKHKSTNIHYVNKKGKVKVCSVYNKTCEGYQKYLNKVDEWEVDVTLQMGDNTLITLIRNFVNSI